MHACIPSMRVEAEDKNGYCVGTPYEYAPCRACGKGCHHADDVHVQRQIQPAGEANGLWHVLCELG